MKNNKTAYHTLTRGAPLALLSSALLVLSFPGFDIEPLAWFALVPLFIALKDRGPMASFTLCALTGIAFFAGVFYWINLLDGFGWLERIMLGIYVGPVFGLFGLLFSLVSRRTKLPSIIIAPVLWVSVEYLRSHFFFLALPWALLGHSQYLNIPLIQVASITGAYGVSFLVLMSNAALSALALDRTKALRPAIAAFLIIAAVHGYGFLVISGAQGTDRVAVTVIQGNIPQNIKWDPKHRKQIFEKHVRLTREAAEGSPASLIVWPEAAVHTLTSDFYLLKSVTGLARDTGTHLLLGSSQRPKFGSFDFRRVHRFNSALLVSPKGRLLERYDKIRLLPFSEYLPYRGLLPWPSRFAAGADDLIPGDEYTVFEVDGARFGVLICWENIFPDLFRQFVKNGAGFMVNITNESRFGETAAPYQFVSMSVFRAAENRVSVARSANTGISGFIDPYGRIIGMVQANDKEIFVEGYLTREIPISQKKTFYTMYGDIFAYMNIFATIFMLALSFLKLRIK